MARTLLTYSVNREMVWSERRGDFVSHVKSRGFDFSVSGAKSQREEMAILDSFVSYLMDETGIDCRGNYFGGAGHEYKCAETGELVEGTFVSIGVQDSDEKELVKRCYDDWKKRWRNDGLYRSNQADSN